MNESSNPSNWERQVLEKLVLATVTEQRRARRWRIFFRFLWLAFLLLLALPLFSGLGGKADGLPGKRHTALLDLAGTIDTDHDTAHRMIDGLQAAFKDSNTQGIIIRANSPGGSPVLSGMVNDEIRRLKRQQPKMPVYVVVEEMCASGCYYIAAAADKIYVDKASVIGSIGVISDGFGFTGLMDKLGVDRRLTTAGKNKALGDPFSPVKPDQQAYRQQLVNDIHQQFIKVVRDGRGARLKDDPDLFSGLFWIGEKAIPLGLADGYGTVESVARDVIKAENTVDFTPRDNFADRLGKRFGVSLAAGVKDIFSPRLY